jgi:hypothetical protein
MADPAFTHLARAGTRSEGARVGPCGQGWNNQPDPAGKRTGALAPGTSKDTGQRPALRVVGAAPAIGPGGTGLTGGGERSRASDAIALTRLRVVDVLAVRPQLLRCVPPTSVHPTRQESGRERSNRCIVRCWPECGAAGPGVLHRTPGPICRCEVGGSPEGLLRAPTPSVPGTRPRKLGSRPERPRPGEPGSLIESGGHRTRDRTILRTRDDAERAGHPDGCRVPGLLPCGSAAAERSCESGREPWPTTLSAERCRQASTLAPEASGYRAMCP